MWKWKWSIKQREPFLFTERTPLTKTRTMVIVFMLMAALVETTIRIL